MLNKNYAMARAVLALAAVAAFPLACVQPQEESVGVSEEALQAAPSLGTAQSFAVLAGSAVTNIGATTLVGSLGVDPGLAISGFPPGLVTGGTVHAGDATALQAESDVTTAYNVLASDACNSDLSGMDLGGLTLTPGVYCFSSSAQLTGKLTLDAQGSPDAVFIFQIGSALTTGSSASVAVIGGGQNCNVFWQVGSSATLGTGTVFTGSVLALTSITLDTGASIAGRALARNGAVTMDTNQIIAGSCLPANTGADAGVDSGGDASTSGASSSTGASSSSASSSSASSSSASSSSTGGSAKSCKTQVPAPRYPRPRGYRY